MIIRGVEFVESAVKFVKGPKARSLGLTTELTEYAF